MKVFYSRFKDSNIINNINAPFGSKFEPFFGDDSCKLRLNIAGKFGDTAKRLIDLQAKLLQLRRKRLGIPS